jgi:hypothetical protein
VLYGVILMLCLVYRFLPRSARPVGWGNRRGAPGGGGGQQDLLGGALAHRRARRPPDRSRLAELLDLHQLDLRSGAPRTGHATTARSRGAARCPGRSARGDVAPQPRDRAPAATRLLRFVHAGRMIPGTHHQGREAARRTSSDDDP